MGASRIIIAIDGYSSCGKSTLARALAKELEYIYIDSGAMYRAAALYFMEQNIPTEALETMEPQKLRELLSNIHISFRLNEDTALSELYLNGNNVEEKIRSISVSATVSRLSAIGEVRKNMVERQREFGKNKGIVMDGRDIGTTVFPEAELKIFMTAAQSIRVERRYQELLSRGIQVSREEVERNIVERDYLDTTRSISPLRQAHDVIVLDNSNLNSKEQLIVAMKWVNELINK